MILNRPKALKLKQFHNLYLRAKLRSQCLVNGMKDTGYRDINGQHIFTEDTLFSPEFGEFKIKYRDDLGGLIMCQAAKDDDDSFEYETVREIGFLEGNLFSVVGRGNDLQEDITRKIVAIITRKSN